MSTTGAVAIQRGTGRYICAECGQRFESGDALVRHQDRNHDFFADGYIEITRGGETRRACRHCLETYPDTPAGNDQLVQHLTDAHDHFTRVLLAEDATHAQ